MRKETNVLYDQLVNNPTDDVNALNHAQKTEHLSDVMRKAAVQNN